jgi:hypothetical protein
VQTRRSSGASVGSDRYASLKGSTNGGTLHYSSVGGDVLRNTVEAVTGAGDAILFGRTSDGGALSVQVLHDKKATRFYPSDASELLELLEGLTRACSE